MHKAMKVAMTQSASARAGLAKTVFWLAGIAAVVAIGDLLLTVIPAEFWSACGAAIQAAHRAYAKAFFDYIWGPFLLGLVIVGAVGIRRDQLVAKSLREFHRSHPLEGREESVAWLARRRVLAMSIGFPVIAATVLACLGLELHGTVLSPANPFLSLSFGVGAAAALGANIDVAYHPLSEVWESDRQPNIPGKAYEKGYFFGRFDATGRVPESMLAAMAAEDRDPYLEGAIVGHRMREVLRAKGVDVDVR